MANFDQDTFSRQKKFFVNLTLTSVFVLFLLSVIWYWFSGIFNEIPIIFSTYSISVLLILFAVKNLQLKLNWAFILWALASVLGNFIIVIYSGGIHSQFTFVFVIVCYGGYMASLRYGKFISYFLLVLIAVIYILNLTNLIPQTTVTDNFLVHFNFLALLFVLLLFMGMGIISAKSSYRLVKAKEEIIRQKEEIEKQKEEVEVAHKEIRDSIDYAKRIQSAILPPLKLVKEYLPASFILYKPKDVVAGDFYWMEHKKDVVLFAAADCTGHGVPGAMVSVVCNNGLNRSVREYGLTDPGKILDKTREIIIEEFEKSEEDVQDGMDISLCALSGQTLKWAGAYNPLWVIRNGEILETKPNKQAIGKVDNPEPFSTHILELEKGDAIYIFTDGFQDQFGGERGKKFKSINFKKVLLTIQAESMEKQKELLLKAFIDWKGNQEMVDDVCVIGVRI